MAQEFERMDPRDSELRDARRHHQNSQIRRFISPDGPTVVLLLPLCDPRPIRDPPVAVSEKVADITAFARHKKKALIGHSAIKWTPVLVIKCNFRNRIRWSVFPPALPASRRARIGKAPLLRPYVLATHCEMCTSAGPYIPS